MLKKLGPLDRILGLMPGIGGMLKGADPAELTRQMSQKEAIVYSMTCQERLNPKILNGSRRSRIAAGSGVLVSDVNRFLKEYQAMQKMMKGLTRGGAAKGLLNSLTTRPFS